MTGFGLALGGNVGDVAATLAAALAALRSAPGVRLDAVSGAHRTAPWGVEDQPAFLNMAAVGATTLDPVALLALLKAIEVRLGRVPRVRNGPREIDLDLLWHGDTAMDTPALTLPHPGLFRRAFVLAPLAEIAADTVVHGRRIGDALAVLTPHGSRVAGSAMCP